MKKENISFLVLAVLLFTFVVQSSSAQSVTSVTDNAELTQLPFLQVSLINQQPDPVAPGSLLELRFMLENLGGDTAEGVDIEFVEEYPFTIYSGEQQQYLGPVQGRQLDEEGVMIRYKIRVDPQALDGEHDVHLRYRFVHDHGKTDWIETDDISIEIRAEQPFLSISHVSDTFLVPGKTTPVNFTMRNDAPSPFKNIEMTLQLDSTPFKAVGTGNTQRLARIPSQQESSLHFDLSTAFETASGVVSLPVTLTFSDDAGNSYTRNETIGLRVFDTPSFIAAIEETEVYASKQKGKIVLSISNVGQTELKFVAATLLSSEDYEIIGPQTSYLGNVESDDFETGEFVIFPYAKKDIMIHFELFYKDVYNQEYHETVDLPLSLYSSRELRRFGLNGGNKSLVKVVSLIILLGIVFFLYRRWEKKKKG